MPRTIVFGATGFIGRSLVAELLNRGEAVAAAGRGSGDALAAWLTARHVDTRALTFVRADITRPGLSLPAQALPDVRDVYNCAGRYAFGMSVPEARATNVTGARHVVEWAAARTQLRRLVHVSGYRVSSEEPRVPDYRRLGAYEASKIEGDAVVRSRARELGVPLTLANPSTVIGPGQYIGLATMVGDLWRGRLPALPGGPDVFVPVVTVDHLARFLAELPAHPRTAGSAYWLLDDTTPDLPALVGLVAGHLGVRAPERSIPVGVIRRLPRALTRADPETLSFLSADRYPTASANAFAESAGIPAPPVDTALREWADHLVATRFGQAPEPRRPAGFHDIAGSRTWVAGERRRPWYVLLHGLPLDCDSWNDVDYLLSAPVLAADLPGLGRSAPAPVGPEAWLAGLLEPVTTRPVLVAHSMACGPALRYAAAHPERIGGLVLVSPSFLQRPPGILARSPLAAALLRRAGADRLARTLGVPAGPAVESAAAHLRRPGAARRVVRALRADRADRAKLRRLLDDVQVPVELVVGADDPLEAATGLPVTTVPGAAHYPQLTAPGAVAHALADLAARRSPADPPAERPVGADPSATAPR